MSVALKHEMMDRSIKIPFFLFNFKQCTDILQVPKIYKIGLYSNELEKALGHTDMSRPNLLDW